MLRKIRHQPIEYDRFKLGNYGIPINVALMYLSYVVIWTPFPAILPVTGNNMNYAGPLLGIVIIAALVGYIKVARVSIWIREQHNRRRFLPRHELNEARGCRPQAHGPFGFSPYS